MRVRITSNIAPQLFREVRTNPARSYRYKERCSMYRAQMCVMLHRSPRYRAHRLSTWEIRKADALHMLFMTHIEVQVTSNIAPRLSREVHANPARSQSR